MKHDTAENTDFVNVGDTISVRIIKVDCDERKIGLSMKNLKGNAQ